MANTVYPNALAQVLQAGINLSSVTVKVWLLQTADYVSSDTFLSDVVVGNRLGSASSAIGSKTFGTVSAGTFDGSDPTITAVPTGTAIGYLVFVDTGTEATSRLLAYIDTKDAEFGGGAISFPTNGGDVTVQMPAAGIFTI